MTGFAVIEFLRPYWVFAIPVIVVMAVWHLRRAASPGDWQAHIQPHLMQAMTRLGRVENGRDPVVVLTPYAVAVFIAVALCGPAFEKSSASTFRNLDGVVFVVDVTGSMTRDDNWPAAITMARAGLTVLRSKPAALVVYAGDSYLAAPLTTDHLQLGQTVSLLDETTVPDRGNRPELALEQAADMLAQAKILAGDVVFITDGEGVSAEAMVAAQRIAGMGAELLVVAVATQIDGEKDPQHAKLAALAAVGNGRIFGVDEVADFMESLANSTADRFEQQELRLVLLTDYGRFLLIFALIPALMFFRRDST